MIISGQSIADPMLNAIINNMMERQEIENEKEKARPKSKLSAGAVESEMNANSASKDLTFKECKGLQLITLFSVSCDKVKKW